MKCVWKFPLEVTDLQTVRMPQGAVVLCVQVQGETPALWAMVDDGARFCDRVFATYGTGNPTDHLPVDVYIGTYQIKGGALVFHVFEKAQ